MGGACRGGPGEPLEEGASLYAGEALGAGVGVGATDPGLHVVGHGVKVVLGHGLVGQQVLLQLRHAVQLVVVLLVVVDLLK